MVRFSFFLIYLYSLSSIELTFIYFSKVFYDSVSVKFVTWHCVRQLDNHVWSTAGLMPSPSSVVDWDITETIDTIASATKLHASFAALRVLSYPHAPGLRSSCCDVVLFCDPEESSLVTDTLTCTARRLLSDVYLIYTRFRELSLLLSLGDSVTLY